ncbi:sensor histidine kinase [Noviherbaspirillum cavernae]|uniref:sensor histidine kinase n=1 Tax=Noviherbaspirillum cavernae TaxID=2320862 RepID=UPI001F5B0A81|nr:histidine kinase [Noviherbaspirillum cavernae]
MPAPLHMRALFRRLPTDLAIVTVFNVLIAVTLTYLVRTGSPLSVNLAYSLCIGTLALLFCDVPRLLLWGEGKPPRLPFFLILAIANPIAWYLGVGIATHILGIPRENFTLARARNPTGFLTFFALVSLFICWYFWNRGKLQLLAAEAATEKARTAAIEKQAMQAQLQMLQVQIEPHMLFNTLANLRGLIALDPPRAQHMLDQLIQYLRATLTSSRAEKTTLDQEFALMEAYLGLMSVRMGARLSHDLQLPDALRDLPVPPMLLQPLVENAIKHGLEPKMDDGHIGIRAEQQDGMLILTVADTGLGLDAPVSDTPGTHVGLANVRERLQALYGERATFTLTPNAPTGVIARLTLPTRP